MLDLALSIALITSTKGRLRDGQTQASLFHHAEHTFGSALLDPGGLKAQGMAFTDSQELGVPYDVAAHVANKGRLPERVTPLGKVGCAGCPAMF